MRALCPGAPGPCQRHRVPAAASGPACGGRWGPGCSRPGACPVGLERGAPDPVRPAAGPSE
eukprot:6593055-Alexandrium_andersonii.AAC.1